VVNVTSDKCYENREWVWGYRESDPMGGHDPYSSSKGCAELVTASYRRSFFGVHDGVRVGVASARAGNVIGGGDFSKYRIIPDFMAALRLGRPLHIRNPDAIRPWQHVLEPLAGYLLLAEKLWENPTKYAQGWNFGPREDDLRSVRWLVEQLNEYARKPVRWKIDGAPNPHEAQLLSLDTAKARAELGWKPQWSLCDGLRAVVSWYEAYAQGEDLRSLVLHQIESYMSMILRNQVDAARTM
jgi:CDP-glucose 4,6-dehydratase